MASLPTMSERALPSRGDLRSALLRLPLEESPYRRLSQEDTSEMLAIASRLQDVIGPWMRTVLMQHLHGRSAVSWTDYARLLARYVQEGDSIDAAVARIEELVSRRRVSAWVTVRLVGPELADDLALDDEVSVLPLLPRSGVPALWEPTCVVRASVELEQAFFEQSEASTPDPDTVEARRRASDARLLMTLATDGPVGFDGVDLMYKDDGEQALALKGMAVVRGGLVQPAYHPAPQDARR